MREPWERALHCTRPVLGRKHTPSMACPMITFYLAGTDGNKLQLDLVNQEKLPQ